MSDHWNPDFIRAMTPKALEDEIEHLHAINAELRGALNDALSIVRPFDLDSMDSALYRNARSVQARTALTNAKEKSGAQ